MKKIFFIGSIIGAFFVLSSMQNNKIAKDNINTTKSLESESDYCDGWKDGYVEGWKDVKGQFALEPLVPLCPLAKLECNEGYRCGYNRGFKAGMKAAKK